MYNVYILCIIARIDHDSSTSLIHKKQKKKAEFYIFRVVVGTLMPDPKNLLKQTILIFFFQNKICKLESLQCIKLYFNLRTGINTNNLSKWSKSHSQHLFVTLIINLITHEDFIRRYILITVVDCGNIISWAKSPLNI